MITVSGSGFAASAPTPIHVIAADGSELPVWTAVTDGNGAFSVQVMIPHTVLLGSYQVHAEGAPDAQATLKIADTSEGALANPTLAVGPVATVPGGVVTVTGTDLGTYLNVPIHLIDPAGAELTIWTARSDDLGAFSVQVLVPHSVQLGVYKLHADGIAPADTSLTVGS